jgi:hypothetical protein
MGTPEGTQGVSTEKVTLSRLAMNTQESSVAYMLLKLWR